nr:MAG TPA: hypothetical protein [Bacteriophage sp.]
MTVVTLFDFKIGVFYMIDTIKIYTMIDKNIYNKSDSSDTF